jgi:hypothetical protein
MMFVIRDMGTGALVGSPFSGAFTWHGTSDRCEMLPAHGLEYRPGETVLQKVYAIEETSEGEGSDSVVGDPVYVSGTDTVTRHTVRSKSASDLAFEATQWVRDRADDYEREVFDMKGLPPGVGNKVTGLGFTVDAIIAELAARGEPATAEFAELLTRIAAVKQAVPKP